MTGTTIFSFCNGCCRETAHDVVETRTVLIDDPAALKSQWEHRVYLVVRCRGCSEYAVREEWRNDEFSLMKVIFHPPRLWRRAPDWMVYLEREDPNLKELLDEVYSAMNNQQARLLSMGVRSVLDRVMTLILEGDTGGFEQKLEKMVESGHLTEKQRANLDVVIDAGSASTHRGFRPPRALLEEMVIVMDGIVREHFITGPMLKTARLNIPPKPSRKKVSTQATTLSENVT